MKLKEFGDVVKDGKEDDGENVGPGWPGMGKLQFNWVIFLQFYDFVIFTFF